MPYRIVQVYTASDIKEPLDALKEKQEIIDFWEGNLRDRRSAYNILCHTEDTQKLTDLLTSMTDEEEDKHVIVLPVQAALPVTQMNEEEQEKREKKRGRSNGVLSREELYEQVKRGARLDMNYMMMVLFSTIVAAIGVLQNNVAVIIGAMVIAPLLGPNLALALGATLGDKVLLKRAAITGLAGLALGIGFSIVFGYLWPGDPYSEELMTRTRVGLDGVAIAIVSGAAGVLSLTTGVSSVLVGVMVAVALMPPTVVLGIMLGHGDLEHAFGAFLLLAINIVCINLAAKVVFRIKGVEPRTWYEKQEVKTHIRWQMVSWTIALGLLIALMFFKRFVVF